MTIYKVILVILLTLISHFLFGQENCGNGIDDDNDGYADCFDSDCPCYAPFDCNVREFFKIFTPISPVQNFSNSGDVLFGRVDFLNDTIIPYYNFTQNGINTGINSIGFNPVDNFIYGINPYSPHQLYRINSLYQVSYLGNLNLPRFCGAGGMDNLGNYFVSSTDNVGELYQIDINTVTYTVIGRTNIRTGDFAFNPADGLFYAWRFRTNPGRGLYTIDPTSALTLPTGIYNNSIDDVGAIFFDTRGDIFMFGNYTPFQSGQETFFKIDMQNNSVNRLGQTYEIVYTDGCSCPYGIELYKNSSPSQIMRGDTTTYIFSINNNSPITFDNLIFKDTLHDGLFFLNNAVLDSGNIVISGNTQGDSIAHLTINNLTTGSHYFHIDVVVPCNYSGPTEYINLAQLTGFNNTSSFYPNEVFSDNPTTLTFEDPDTLLISFNSPIIDTSFISICKNDSIQLTNGTYISAQGTYLDTFTNSFGCESIIQINLNHFQTLIDTIPLTLCNNDSFFFAGDWIYSTGQYFDSILSSSGCDSIIFLDLEVISLTVVTIQDSFCDGETYTLPNGTITDTAGIFSDTFYSASGCDSIINITQLSLNFSSDTLILDTICENDFHNLPNGNSTNVSGYYFDTLTNQTGCDSFIITNLTVIPTFFDTLYEFICNGDSVLLPNGSFAFQTGNFISSFSNKYSCDSTYLSIVTVYLKYFNEIFDTICENDSYTLPDGSVTNQTGVYRDTFLTINSCDSIIISNLFVSASSISYIVDTVCNNEFYTLPNGDTVTTPGHYVDTLINQFSCDSIIDIIILIAQSSTDSFDIEICNNENHQLPDGRSVSQTGVYISALNNRYGCDSTIITNLSVYNFTFYDTVCSLNNGYVLPNGDTVFQSGNYSNTFTSIGNCDSVININLSVSNITLNFTTDSVDCFGENSGTVSTSIDSNNSNFPIDYQWSNGFSGSSLEELTAGIYIVTTTDALGCSIIDTIEVFQPPIMSYNIETVDVSCFGEDDGQVTVEASGGAPEYNISISGVSSGNGVFNALSAGNYTLNITDANGCILTNEINIYQPDSIELYTEPDSIFGESGETISVEISTNYNLSTSFNWDNNYGVSCLDCNNPNIILTDSTEFLLVSTFSESSTRSGVICPKEFIIPVTVLFNEDVFIPNAFSPNGDGENDVFRFYGTLERIRTFKIRIFDCWGELVYESSDPYFGWDGTFKGEAMNQNVFTYYVAYSFIGDNRHKVQAKGSITLLR